MLTYTTKKVRGGARQLTSKEVTIGHWETHLAEDLEDILSRAEERVEGANRAGS